jgi:hypothetical protein
MGPADRPITMDCWVSYDAHDVAMALLLALIAVILLAVICCIVSREQGVGQREIRVPPILPARKRKDKPTGERKPKRGSKPKGEPKRKVEVNQEERWPGSRAYQPASQPAKPRPLHPSRPACWEMSKSEAWLQAPPQAHATPRRQSTVVLHSDEHPKHCKECCQGLNHRVDSRKVLSSSLWAAALLRCMSEGEEGSRDEAARTRHGGLPSFRQPKPPCCDCSLTAQ